MDHSKWTVCLLTKAILAQPTCLWSKNGPWAGKVEKSKDLLESLPPRAAIAEYPLEIYNHSFGRRAYR
jgi:hypothetical protein